MRARSPWLLLTTLAASCALESFERGAARPPDEKPPDPVALCTAAGLPSRPDAVDEDGETFVVALRSVTWPDLPLADPGDGGHGPKDEVPGFDLDGRCSCTADVKFACITAPGALLGNHCDDEEGRDNNLAIAFAPLSAVAPSNLTTLFSDAAEVGAWSLLIEVRGYGGGFDDPRVEVATYSAVGFEGIGGPSWNGQDLWDVRADSFAVDGRLVQPEPISFDPDAYVADGTLVARLPWLDLNLSIDQVEGLVRISQARLTAKVESLPFGTGLAEGTIGGWFADEDILRFLSSYRFKPFGENAKSAFLCNDPSDTVYKVFRSTACRAADGRLDEGSPDPACNAVSVGLGFTADPANLGDVVEVPFPPSACEEGRDPRFDACPSN